MPSQSGRLKISRSKELVPGTVEDEDIVEIPDTPSPVKKPQKSSIFARKPKENANTSNIQTRSSPQKSQKQNLTLDETIESPPKMKPQPKKDAKSKRVIDSDSDDDFSFFEPKRSKLVDEKESRAVSAEASKVTKTPVAKAMSRPKPVAAKSSASSSANDDSDLFNFTSSKKTEPKLTRRLEKAAQAYSAGAGQKIHSSHSEVSQLSRSMNKSAIASQSSGLKRVNAEPEDDLFQFDSKRSKKNEPKLTRRNQKVSETVSTKSTDSSGFSAKTTVAIVSTSTSDMTFDMTPGQDCPSTPWISSKSLSSFKKEEPGSEKGQSSSSAVLDTSAKKTFCQIIPTAPNAGGATEKRGKTFKKKINYRPQTKVIPTRDLSLQDCNLLYPKPL